MRIQGGHPDPHSSGSILIPLNASTPSFRSYFTKGERRTNGCFYSECMYTERMQCHSTKTFRQEASGRCHITA
jgi:hypothetical protein